MTIRRRALSDGPLGGPQPVTTVQRIVRASVAWQPRKGAAVLPIRILVSGETARVVPDLCREIAAKLGYVYGSTVIPRDSVPQGAVSADARVVAGVIVSLDANQPAPEFGDSGFSGGVVHVTLTQPTTNNVDDLDLFIDRREAQQRRRIRGTIGRCRGVYFNTDLVGTLTRTIAQNGPAGIKYTRRRCCHGWTNPVLQTRERRRDHP